jgi:hypothetical protein
VYPWESEGALTATLETPEGALKAAMNELPFHRPFQPPALQLMLYTLWEAE